MAFKDDSQKALENYWRTAVVIDDAASGGAPEDVPQQLQAVGRDTVVQQSAEPEQAREFLGAPLNAPALVEAFLEKNILCTILTSKDVLEKNSDALRRAVVAYQMRELRLQGIV